jgi:hypothetical protein
MARRRGISLVTRSQVQIGRSDPLANRSESHDGSMSQERIGRHSEPVNPKDPGIPPPDDIDKASTDLRWVPRLVRRFWMIRGRIRSIRSALHPRLTPDELELRDYLELQKEMDRVCKKEFQRYKKVITRTMLQIGNSVQSDRLYFDLVKWRGFSRDEAFTKITLILDVQHVPAYVLVSRLGRDPRWTDDLAAAIGLPVHWEVGAFGALLTIHRPVEPPKEPRRGITVEDLASADEFIWV